MANETKNTTTVTNETKVEGTKFDVPLKSGSGLTWKESKPRTWEDTDDTWEDLEETLEWTNQSK